MPSTYFPPHSTTAIYAAVRSLPEELRRNLPPAWKLTAAIGKARLQWASDIAGRPPSAYIVVGTSEFTLKDHSLGFVGEARPMGALAETGAGLYFLACKIFRYLSFQRDSSTLGDTHLIVSSAYAELHSAVELLRNLLKVKDDQQVRPSIVLAKRLVMASPSYHQIEDVTSRSSGSGAGQQLYYLRCKLAAHRGLSETATAQLNPKKKLDSNEGISVAQLEGLGAGAFSSVKLFEHLKSAIGWILEIAQLLMALGEFVIIPADKSRRVIVLLSVIDTEAHNFGSIVAGAWKPFDGREIDLELKPIFKKPHRWAAPPKAEKSKISYSYSRVIAQARELFAEFLRTSTALPFASYSPLRAAEGTQFGSPVDENTHAATRKASGLTS